MQLNHFPIYPCFGCRKKWYFIYIWRVWNYRRYTLSLGLIVGNIDNIAKIVGKQEYNGMM